MKERVLKPNQKIRVVHCGAPNLNIMTVFTTVKNVENTFDYCTIVAVKKALEELRNPQYVGTLATHNQVTVQVDLM